MWLLLLISQCIISLQTESIFSDLYLLNSNKKFRILNDTCQKVYTVRFVTVPPDIDGIAEIEVWGSANLMEDLLLHWEETPAQQTKYRGVYDKSNFYFLFEVRDTNIVIWDTIKNELDVIWEDRVEMFFTPDRKFQTYYCLEIDPFGRYLGNSGSLGKKIDITWECEGCQFEGKINKDGYILEGVIPLKTLESMGVYNVNSIMNAGVYRADFNETGIPEAPEMHWISWVKSESLKPNFHIPSSLGCFIFEKQH